MKSLLKIIFIGLAYFIAGKAALLLAIPPGYASPIWPAAGIALACVLVYGYRVWIGIFLGSFLINLEISAQYFPAEAAIFSICLPMVIALGASLQAIFGAFLIRQFLKIDINFSSVKSVFIFTVCGAVLSCLISSTIGTISLTSSKIILVDRAWIHLLVWWFGDAIGLLLFTPLTLVFIARHYHAWRDRAITLTIPLLITFFIIGGVFYLTAQLQQETLQKEFQTVADKFSESLKDQIHQYSEVLYSIKAFYESSGEVTRDEFHQFVQHAFDHYPGIQALEWVPKIPQDQQDIYIQQARADGFPDFQITYHDNEGHLISSDQDKDFYYPVFFVEPYEGNEMALGFDLSSNTSRLKAMQHAAEVKGFCATEPVQLVQEYINTPGFLLFLPVFDPSDQLRGFVLGVFRVPSIIQDAFESHKNDRRSFRLDVFDVTDKKGKILYRDKLPSSESDSVIFHQTFVKFSERIWRLQFTATDRFFRLHESWMSWLILAGGLFLASILGAFLLLVTGQASEVAHLVKLRTKELEDSKNEAEEAEERFRVIFDNAPMGISIVNLEGCFEYMNPYLVEMLGYPEEELKAKTFMELTHPDDRSLNSIKYRDLLSGHTEIFHIEKRYITKQGKIIWGGTFVVPFKDENGKVVRVMGLVEDITERKISQQALQQSEERLELAIKGGKVGIWDWFDVSKDDEWWSDQFYSLLGYKTKEVPASLEGFKSLIHPDDLKRTFEAVQDALDGKKPFDVEYRLKHKNGEYRWFNGRAEVIQDKEGHSTRMTGTIADIHERKVAEIEMKSLAEELGRSNHELEQFAYVASHDLQEPVRKIVGFTQLFEETFEGNLSEDQKKYMKFIIDGAHRMQALIKDLLEYSRAGRKEFEVLECAFSGLANEAIRNLENVISENEAKVTVVEPLPSLYVNGVLMVQVFQNLINNGLKYRSEAAPEIEISYEEQENQHVFIVKDNGIGIQPQFHERIFEIFQRLHSKDKYKGTGIGLALCRRIVERHGGAIWVESQVGEGSLFKFSLPKR